jgi:DNA polymerase-4
MAMGLAQRLCSNLIVVPTRHSQYRAVSARVMQLLRGFTPKIEQLSIDEAFLDVTELVDNDGSLTGGILALEIQRRVDEELGLSCSLGVASNKMVAKIANDCGKAAVNTGHSPQALCVVEAGREAEFLAPLPVLCAVGRGAKARSQSQEFGNRDHWRAGAVERARLDAKVWTPRR